MRLPPALAAKLTEQVLAELPPPPARVLEIGCGDDGGVVEELAAAGYDVLGVDPRAPAGPRFLRRRYQELGDEMYDAVLAERVLHHVEPLGQSLDRLAALAPRLVVDEFAWDLIDEPTRRWYEEQHGALRADGAALSGPPDLAEWRARWDGLHPSTLLRRELARRYDEQLYEPRPYLYRWLAGPATEPLERQLVADGVIRPIGFRWVGVRRSVGGWQHELEPSAAGLER